MSQESPEITYPCEWGYRVIGTTEEPMRNSIASILGDKNYSISRSNVSKGGKYLSLSLTLVVDSEVERIEIYESLKANGEIKMVL